MTEPVLVICDKYLHSAVYTLLLPIYTVIILCTGNSSLYYDQSEFYPSDNRPKFSQLLYEHYTIVISFFFHSVNGTFKLLKEALVWPIAANCSQRFQVYVCVSKLKYNSVRCLWRCNKYNFFLSSCTLYHDDFKIS